MNKDYNIKSTHREGEVREGVEGIETTISRREGCTTCEKGFIINRVKINFGGSLLKL